MPRNLTTEISPAQDTVRIGIELEGLELSALNGQKNSAIDPSRIWNNSELKQISKTPSSEPLFSVLIVMAISVASILRQRKHKKKN